jgi:hypothetical protein
MNRKDRTRLKKQGFLDKIFTAIKREFNTGYTRGITGSASEENCPITSKERITGSYDYNIEAPIVEEIIEEPIEEIIEELLEEVIEEPIEELLEEPIEEVVQAETRTTPKWKRQIQIKNHESWMNLRLYRQRTLRKGSKILEEMVREAESEKQGIDPRKIKLENNYEQG